jgi:hypothetical protein
LVRSCFSDFGAYLFQPQELLKTRCVGDQLTGLVCVATDGLSGVLASVM